MCAATSQEDWMNFFVLAGEPSIGRSGPMSQKGTPIPVTVHVGKGEGVGEGTSGGREGGTGEEGAMGFSRCLERVTHSIHLSG